MSESFVDLTYRGLSLGKRVKLTELRPSTGYVEMPQPMPVGTQIRITTDEAVAIDATVIGVREQTAGSERPPGMLLKPALEGDAGAWWQPRVTLPEIEKPAPPKRPSQPPPTPPVIVTRRVTKPGIAVPEIVDDGQDTGVMDAIDPDMLEEVSVPNAVDDGKQTTAMDAVDLAALGIDPSAPSVTAQMATVAAIEDEDGNGDKPEGKSKKKKKKR